MIPRTRATAWRAGILLALAAVAVGGVILSVTGLRDGGAQVRAPDPADAAPPARLDPATLNLAEPCPRARATLPLGRPRVGAAFARFRAAGGTVYVTAAGFSKGGIFDPEVGVTAIEIGRLRTPPSHDPRSSVTRNVLRETRVREGTWSSVELPRGRFWLWSSNSAEITVRSCERGGVSAAVPVVPGFPSPESTPRP